MKKALYSLMVCIPISVGLMALESGCMSPSAQKVAVNTIYSVQTATHAAYSGFIVAVAKGAAPTNGVPDVVKALVKFDAATLVALDAVQFNTNAIAPASLSQSSVDVINLITKFTKK